MTTDFDGFGCGTARVMWASVCLLAFAIVSIGCDVDLDVDQNVYACNTSEDCRDGYNCVAVPDKTRRECRLADAVDSPDATDADDEDVPDARDTSDGNTDTNDDTTDTRDTASTDTADTTQADALQCDAGVSCYTGPEETQNNGVCESGTWVCTGTGEIQCEGEILPFEEVCDSGADEDCDGDIDCADSDCTAECNLANAAHWFFTTKAKHDGNFGGVAAAHSFCAEQAEGAGLEREDWNAVIANQQTGPENYIEVTGDVVLLDGQLFANQNNFWSGPFVAPEIDEFGAQIAGASDARAWTGVEPQGGWAPEQCFDSTPWNSAKSGVDGMTGSLAGQGTSAWLGDTTQSCDQQWHVYCISNQN